MPHRDYIVDGVKYPSVTEVLGDEPKPWLAAWRIKWGNLAKRKTCAASAVGSEFHRLAEAHILEMPFSLASRRLDIMLRRFINWCASSGFQLKESELHVVSHTYGYHGTFDAVGYLADKPRTLALFDWKTSSAVYPDMVLQLAAYAQAYSEQTGRFITRGIIVHISKDKPAHKLRVHEFRLNKRIFNRFSKRLAKFKERHANESNVILGKTVQGAGMERNPFGAYGQGTTHQSDTIQNAASDGRGT